MDRRRPPFIGVGGGGDDFAEALDAGNSPEKTEKTGPNKPDPFGADGFFGVVGVLSLGPLPNAAFAILFSPSCSVSGGRLKSSLLNLFLPLLLLYILRLLLLLLLLL